MTLPSAFLKEIKNYDYSSLGMKPEALRAVIRATPKMVATAVIVNRSTAETGSIYMKSADTDGRPIPLSHPSTTFRGMNHPMPVMKMRFPSMWSAMMPE